MPGSFKEVRSGLIPTQYYEADAWFPDGEVLLEGTILLHSEDITSNVKDRRLRPPSPLFKHPTALGQVQKKLMFYGKEVRRYPRPRKPFYPDPIGSPAVWHWENPGDLVHIVSVGVHPSIQGSADAPEWGNRIRQKIKSDAMNLSVMVAEMRQTTTMLADLSMKALRIIRDVRKGRIPQALKGHNLTTSAENHLMIQYGIRPLVNDVLGSLKRLEVAISGGIVRRYATRAEKSTDVDYFLNEEETVRVRGRKKVTIDAVVYALIQPDPPEFTFGSPAELAWEMIPFSFVVDWTLGIGDFLSSIDALSDVPQYWGTYTTKTSNLAEVEYSDLGEGITMSKKPKIDIQKHRRDVIVKIPLDFPQWKPDVSLLHMANGAALLKSAHTSYKRNKLTRRR